MYKKYFILLAVVLLPFMVLCDDWYVDSSAPPNGNGSILSPFDTIVEALNILSAGDVVILFEGEYHENISIVRDISMTLRSENVSGEYLTDTTILRGDAIGGDIITIDRNIVSTAEITIAGLTISHPEGISGRGVNIFSGDCVNLGTIVFNYCVFSGNTIDDGDGGGVYVKNESILLNESGGIELHNCNVINNEALNGGGISIHNTKDNIEITGCFFSGNHAVYDPDIGEEGVGGTGGGVRINNIQMNENDDNVLLVQDCNFISNTCEINGGGLSIANIYPETEIYNCLFEDNLSVFAGGIYIANTGQADNPEWITIDECSFLNNMAATISPDPLVWGNCGGGITADYSSYCILNSEFNENQTRGSGGAIAAQSSELLLRNSTVTNNYAGGSGGGIFLASKSGGDGCIADMGNVIITENIAGYQPYFSSGVGGGIGGIYVQEFYGTNLEVCDNESRGQDAAGGGIFLDCDPSTDGITTIDNSMINNNISDAYGGGLHISRYYSVELDNLEVNDNTVRSICDNYCDGIGLYLSYISDGLCRISNCQFNNNNYTLLNHNTPESAQGGGVYVKGTWLIMDDCEIKDNSTLYGSGIAFGAYDDDFDAAFISNTIISGNVRHHESPGPSGAVYILDEDYNHPQQVEFTNCTIADNETDETGIGGIELHGQVTGGGVELKNCILWGNAGDQYNDLITDITYSDLEVENVTGSGNINLDPVFIQEPGNPANEYFLKWNETIKSPCIDTGDPDTDEDLYDWWKDEDDQDADGTRLDMGAVPARQHEMERKPYYTGLFGSSSSRWYWHSYPLLEVMTSGYNTIEEVFQLGVAFDEDNLESIGCQPLNGEDYWEVSYDGGWSNSDKEMIRYQGYKVHVMYDPDQDYVNLDISGEKIVEDASFDVTGGDFDNWMGYFLTESMHFTEAFGENLDYFTLIKSKNWVAARINGVWYLEQGSWTPNLNPGEMVIARAYRDMEDFHWNYAGETSENVEREKTTYFDYEEEADYTGVFVSVPADSQYQELAVFADGECKGAAVVEDTLVQINAYLDDVPAGVQLEIVSWSGRGFGEKKYSKLILKDKANNICNYGYWQNDPAEEYYFISLTNHQPDNTLPVYNAAVYPNPFNPELTISLNIFESCSGEISVYNIRGQLIKRIYEGTMLKGNQQFIWQGDNRYGNPVSSGVYFCKIKIGESEEIMKAVLMK
jgi:Secretion system C-terminal sorting domain